MKHVIEAFHAMAPTRAEIAACNYIHCHEV